MANNQRSTKKAKKSRRSRRGYWFGLVKTEVEADRQQRGEPPDLAEDEVLAWADAFFARTGDWPMFDSGPIPEAPGDTWNAVQSALYNGHRGFAGRSTIPKLLLEHRGKRSIAHAPSLSIPQILAWADAFRARAGRWPAHSSGPVAVAPGETWCAIDCALSLGIRGLPGGSSLSRLLARERNASLSRDGRSLTIPEILRWADAYHERHGKWPKENSGPIPEAQGENWSRVSDALSFGRSGLPAGLTLARLLSQERGVRHARDVKAITAEQILAWADAHKARTGEWPTCLSGPIPEAAGENWTLVQSALIRGHRGVPGGSSLARFLAESGRTRHRVQPRDLTITGSFLEPTHSSRAPANGRK